MRSAVLYVELAEAASGPIPRPVGPDYIWGDALDELGRLSPDARIVNLETSVTQSDDHWPRKGIHYRMNPANVDCLTSARIDCCVLANNHVLDWGYAGLEDTLEALRRADIETAGAGGGRQQASRPGVVGLPGDRRVIVYACGTGSSGIPADWAAAPDRPGVNRLDDLSMATVRRIRDELSPIRRPGDLVVVSIHWGGNWGYRVPRDHVDFAHGLIDLADVDVVHGHSSHHAKAIEVHGGRLILYGCGDFVTDYEGIGGHERFRGDLSVMYFVDLDPSGRLAGLLVKPMRMRRFQVRYADADDVTWLADVLDREGSKFGTRVERCESGDLGLRWTRNDSTSD